MEVRVEEVKVEVRVEKVEEVRVEVKVVEVRVTIMCVSAGEERPSGC